MFLGPGHVGAKGRLLRVWILNIGLSVEENGKCWHAPCVRRPDPTRKSAPFAGKCAAALISATNWIQGDTEGCENGT